jgi:hypothetical protein
MQTKMVVNISNYLLFIFLLFLTVAVNWPIVMADLMYPEQPVLYNANQLIHSFADFIHIYTHPQLLSAAASYFRPSGHFLLHQLVTSLVGWHNTQALLITNLLFQGMSGYLMIRIYQTLFPGLKVGGFIAFSFYLMNPSLTLSRVMIMNFEFAYVFFVLASLYCFMIFCQKNLEHQQQTNIRNLTFQHQYLLLGSLFLYAFAVTFKEPAITAGPVLAWYLLVAVYKPNQFLQVFKNKYIVSMLLGLGLISILLACYVESSRINPNGLALEATPINLVIKSAKEFLRYLLSLPKSYYSNDVLSVMEFIRGAQIPGVIHYLTWGLLTVTFVSLFWRKSREYKKSLVFLSVALIMFLSLPVYWAMGFPWHLSLPIVFEGLLLGFGVEFFALHFFNKKITYMTGLTLAMLISLTTYQMDNLNIDYINHTRKSLAFKVDHNAVFHPPAIKKLLNADSILVVEDNKNLGDFWLGSSMYPYLTLDDDSHINDLAPFMERQVMNFNFEPGRQEIVYNLDSLFYRAQKNFFWQVQPVYNGTLFRWAYLMPNLKEELIRFKDDDMSRVPNPILLSWIRHIDNIFCVTYDNAGNWYDNTALFKTNIVLEQKRRQLVVSQYHSLPTTALLASASTPTKLPYADPELCQVQCDNEQDCKGFTYTQSTNKDLVTAYCSFNTTQQLASSKPCQSCTNYVKTG